MVVVVYVVVAVAVAVAPALQVTSGMPTPTAVYCLIYLPVVVVFVEA